jgi:hypothetical protein
MRDLSIVRFRRLGDETFTIMSLSPGGCGANSAYHTKPQANGPHA